jgi:hypothetical protein
MKITYTDLIAWLGPAADDLTPDQIDRLHREAQRIYSRYPDPDDQELRDAALSAAVQWLLGDITLERAREELVSARIAAARASAAAQQVAVMAHGDGMPESRAAAAAGIDRMTLRRALGKR